MIGYALVRNDAGLYREWILKNFGYVPVHGAMADSYLSFLKHIKRLSKMTGISKEQIALDIKSDYIKCSQSEGI